MVFKNFTINKNKHKNALCFDDKEVSLGDITFNDAIVNNVFLPNATTLSHQSSWHKSEFCCVEGINAPQCQTFSIDNAPSLQEIKDITMLSCENVEVGPKDYYVVGEFGLPNLTNLAIKTDNGKRLALRKCASLKSIDISFEKFTYSNGH